MAVSVDQSSVEKLWARAEQGEAVACHDLGQNYLTGQNGIPKDEIQALEWLRKAAEQNPRSLRGSNQKEVSDHNLAIVRAQDSLGHCYRHGLGTIHDNEEGFLWTEKAAKQGYAPAQHSLGDCYLKGLGVAKNETDAYVWIERAAQQGLAPAQYALAVYYQFGSVTAQPNKELAFTWLKKAADNNDTDALFALAGCYFAGESNISNNKLANYYLRKAAELGHVRAQFEVAKNHMLGVQKSKFLPFKWHHQKEAVKWFRAAAEQEHIGASQFLTLGAMQRWYQPSNKAELFKLCCLSLCEPKIQEPERGEIGPADKVDLRVFARQQIKQVTAESVVLPNGVACEFRFPDRSATSVLYERGRVRNGAFMPRLTVNIL